MKFNLPALSTGYSISKSSKSSLVQDVASSKRSFYKLTGVSIRLLTTLLIIFMQLFRCDTANAMEVWWSPKFKNDVLSEYKIKSFDPSDVKKAMKLVVYEPYRSEKRNIIGCESIKSVRSDADWDYKDEVYLSSALKNCQVLEWIISAKPAIEVNEVVNYKFTANSLKELPACFNSKGEFSYVDMMEKAHARGESIAGAGLWGADYKFGLELVTIGDNFEVRMIGRGDFNSDGIPDLLVHVQTPNFGGYHLLSKKKKDRVFRVLGPEFAGMNYCAPTWDSILSVCLAPAVAKVRDDVGKLYKQKKYDAVINVAQEYIKGCQGDISDVPLAWLLNDVALAQARSGKPESCLDSVRQINKLYYYPGGEVFKKAMTTNYLCKSAMGK